MKSEPPIAQMNVELKGTSDEASIQFADWMVLPATADPLRRDIEESLFEMEVDADLEMTRRRLREWDEAEYIKMVFKEEAHMVGMVLQEVNAKDYVADMWVARDGHRLMLRMMLRGKATPYLTHSVLYGTASWIEAAKYPAVRVEAFVGSDQSAIDFWRPSCESCERPIPVNVLDRPFDQDYCPRCKDAQAGVIVASLGEAVVV